MKYLMSRIDGGFRVYHRDGDTAVVRGDFYGKDAEKYARLHAAMLEAQDPEPKEPPVPPRPWTIKSVGAAIGIFANDGYAQDAILRIDKPIGQADDTWERTRVVLEWAVDCVNEIHKEPEPDSV